MALIDKETIRAEIERRLSWRITLEARAAYNNILRFLDSLPEQPVIKKSNALFDECVKNCDPATMKEVSDYVDKMLGKQPVEGLEDDKIIDYAHSKFYYDKDFDGYGHSKFRPVFTREDLISFARHFAEWQKVKMLTESSKKEVDEFMSRCDRDVLDELNRWRFTTACQEFIEQGIFDYGCAKHFAEWGAEKKSIEIFKKQNCQGCGTQRCMGDGEWLEGCKAFQAWRIEYLKK